MNRNLTPIEGVEDFDSARELAPNTSAATEKERLPPRGGISCPFCGDEDFDHVGLRGHLFRWCEAFNEADSDDRWAAYWTAAAREHSSPRQVPQPIREAK